MGRIVQKYGGSSVADADSIKRVARRIARARADGHDIIIVISAMGDTTDELIFQMAQGFFFWKMCLVVKIL